MKRRDFLTGTIGAGVLSGALPVARGAVALPGDPAAPVSPPHSGAPSLPPQEKAVNSFAGKAVPIGDEERKTRIEKAQRLMASQAMDGLVLEGGTTLRYFTGVRWGRSERAFLAVIPAQGDPWYLAPKFEESRAAEQTASAALYTWEEDESPYEVLGKAMRDRGMAASSIGLEETTRYFVTEGIGRELAAASIVNGTSVTAGCRAVKSPAETALMQLANDITAEVYRRTVPLLKPGMTEREFGRMISNTFSDFGVGGGALVLFGEASAHPHGLEKEVTLREGEIVLVDGGCSVEEYSSDVTRTTVLGTPTSRMAKIFETVLAAQHAGLRTARPGVPAEAIDAAARKVIDDAGFGPGYRYFTHRLGHGIGMEGHEWYYLVRGNRRPETAGEIHSNEPGIYIPGEFGIRIEDEMVITDDGARLMLPSPSGLGSMFG